MNLTVKVLSLFFALLMLFGTVACSEKGDMTDESVSTEKSEETETDSFSSLPDVNYGGKDYSILNADLASIEGSLGIEFESDEEATSAISLSVYQRNRDVEERFGVNIKHLATQTLYDTLVATVGSGDLDYHVIYGDYSSMSNLSAGLYLMNLNDIPNIDFSADYWNKSANENLTINGRQYLAINDAPYTTLITTHCMYFNKSLSAEFLGSENLPYDLVFDGSWTIDKLIETSKGVSKEGGDNVWDEEDQYGVALSIGSSTMFGVSFGESVFPINIENGEIVETDEEKWANMISKVYTLLYNNENSTYVGAHLSDTAMTMFVKSNVLYYIGALCDAPMYFRDMEDDFGILPMPKYDEEQKEYHTPLSGASLVLGVSVLPEGSELDFIGTVTEAMAIRSNELLRTAVYETVFDNQLSRDEESKRTMSIIVDALYVDFVFIHAGGGIEGYYGEMHMLMEQRSDAYASARRRNKTKVEKYYQGVIDNYNGLKD